MSGKRGKKKKEKSIRVCASFSKENTNPFALERYLGLTPSHSAADIVGGILTVWRGGKSTTLIVLSRLAILKTFGTVNMTAGFKGPEVVLAWRALALLRISASLDARRLSRIVGQFLVAARAHDDLVFFGLGAGVPRETLTSGWSRLE